MSFNLTILGSNSAIPTIKKNPTAQLLNADERFFLIDCGEGTQIQLLKNNIKAHKINHIFISHLHGDHYFGLIGLINTMHLLGRTKELNLYAHQPLKEIIDLQFQASNTELRFALFFHPIPTDKEKVLFEDESIIVSNLILKHSIDSSGFLFREKKASKNIIKEKIEIYDIPIEQIANIKKGADYKLKDGNMISNDELTIVAKKPHSYAFCSDTTYVAENAEKIKDVTILYHEATFMQDLEEKAIQTGHSTTIHAATLAKQANVKQLLIGHFSSRYNDLDGLLAETKSVFENTILAKDGTTFDFDLI
ncbi:MAG: ribonuclease Z [Bacteroidota bacterium]|nr:ribonuclease Z [Bacteroidota bacterium]